jgi:hypothetical protein
MQYSIASRQQKYFLSPQIFADKRRLDIGVAKASGLAIRVDSREFAANENNESGKL